MLLEQHNGIVPDSAGHLGLDAIAGADQRFGILRQDDCQNVAAIFGDDGVGRPSARTAVANQLPIHECGPGRYSFASHDLDVNEIGAIDVFDQQISRAGRKLGRNSPVMDHSIFPTLPTGKYPACGSISPVVNGEFFPYNEAMSNPLDSTIATERSCRGTRRDIEWFVQNNFMALPNSLLRAASFAWFSLLTAPRPECCFPAPQKAHRETMLTFHYELGAWAAI